MRKRFTDKTSEAIEETLAVFDAIRERHEGPLSAEAAASLTAAVMARRGPGVGIITD